MNYFLADFSNLEVETTVPQRRQLGGDFENDAWKDTIICLLFIHHLGKSTNSHRLVFREIVDQHPSTEQ
jgi:hypothetical protein